jgi:L-cysteine desulfidase
MYLISQKEQHQKDTPTDSRKLARSLRASSLTAIHVPPNSHYMTAR